MLTSMLKPVRLWLLAPLAALILAGCGGGSSHKTSTDAVQAEVVSSATRGPLTVEHVNYITFDGTTVPALFSIPRAFPARGCLIWENGFGSTKEGTERFWAGAARLGLAVFAIDLRDHGQRAAYPNQRYVAVRSPTLLRNLIAGTVKDLEYATEYLWAQPVCHHNIGYAGLSLGGMIGAIFAAQDHRVRAVVLMSVPPDLISLAATDHIVMPGIHNNPAALAKAKRIVAPVAPARWIGQIPPRPLLLMFGIHDPLVPPRFARATVAAARSPTQVIHYDGGHIPFFGPAAKSNEKAIGLFFLHNLVEPTFGVTPAQTTG